MLAGMDVTAEQREVDGIHAEPLDEVDDEKSVKTEPLDETLDSYSALALLLREVNEVDVRAEPLDDVDVQAEPLDKLEIEVDPIDEKDSPLALDPIDERIALRSSDSVKVLDVLMTARQRYWDEDAGHAIMTCRGMFYKHEFWLIDMGLDAEAFADTLASATTRTEHLEHVLRFRRVHAGRLRMAYKIPRAEFVRDGLF